MTLKKREEVRIRTKEQKCSFWRKTAGCRLSKAASNLCRTWEPSTDRKSEKIFSEQKDYRFTHITCTFMPVAASGIRNPRCLSIVLQIRFLPTEYYQIWIEGGCFIVRFPNPLYKVKCRTFLVSILPPPLVKPKAQIWPRTFWWHPLKFALKESFLSQER